MDLHLAYIIYQNIQTHLENRTHMSYHSTRTRTPESYTDDTLSSLNSSLQIYTKVRVK